MALNGQPLITVNSPAQQAAQVSESSCLTHTAMVPQMSCLVLADSLVLW